MINKSISPPDEIDVLDEMKKFLEIFSLVAEFERRKMVNRID
jgi:hypothetical protein